MQEAHAIKKKRSGEKHGYWSEFWGLLNEISQNISETWSVLHSKYLLPNFKIHSNFALLNNTKLVTDGEVRI